MESEEKFINILKENLIHLRHQETQRMWIANIFVALVVGTSAYLATLDNLDKIPCFIPLVFLIISLLCLLITLKVNYVFTKTKNAIEKIFDEGKISLGKQKDWRKYVLLLESTGIMRVLKVRYLYTLIYIISISAAIFLIIPPSVNLLWRILAAIPLLLVYIIFIFIDLRRKEQT